MIVATVNIEIIVSSNIPNSANSSTTVAVVEKLFLAAKCRKEERRKQVLQCNLCMMIHNHKPEWHVKTLVTVRVQILKIDCSISRYYLNHFTIWNQTLNGGALS